MKKFLSVLLFSVTASASALETEPTETKIVIVCFSGTGNTMAVAETISGPIRNRRILMQDRRLKMI